MTTTRATLDAALGTQFSADTDPTSALAQALARNAQASAKLTAANSEKGPDIARSSSPLHAAAQDKARVKREKAMKAAVVPVSAPVAPPSDKEAIVSKRARNARVYDEEAITDAWGTIERLLAEG